MILLFYFIIYLTGYLGFYWNPRAAVSGRQWTAKRW